jgi:hypothetical protein
VSQLDNHVDVIAAKDAAPGNKWMVFDRFDDYRPGAVMVFVEQAARARFIDALAQTRERRAVHPGYAEGSAQSRVPPPRAPEPQYSRSSATRRSH